MKIAVATEGSNVSMHFGRCAGYTIYEARDGRIISGSFEPAPEHQPGMMPKWLKEKEADVVIAGGAGAMARELFRDMGIILVLGASGPVAEAADSYIKGTLSQGESLCDNSGTCSH